MRINMKKIYFSSIVYLVPFVVSAQATGNSGGFANLGAVLRYVMEILNLVLPILFAAAFIVFFWGLSKFILNSSGSPADITKGKSYMMWGILALFILVSARAIISMATAELEIGDKTQNAKILPFLPGGRSN